MFSEVEKAMVETPKSDKICNCLAFENTNWCSKINNFRFKMIRF